MDDAIPPSHPLPLTLLLLPSVFPSISVFSSESDLGCSKQQGAEAGSKALVSQTRALTAGPLEPAFRVKVASLACLVERRKVKSKVKSLLKTKPDSEMNTGKLRVSPLGSLNPL